MKLTRNSKCPLCGSGMTQYANEFSFDGIPAPIRHNICDNATCGLPVRLWEAVEDLVECRRQLHSMYPQIKDSSVEQ